MEMAKITSKGQVTIPTEIMKKLNLKGGDKLVFIEKDGIVYIKSESDVEKRLQAYYSALVEKKEKDS